MPNPMEEMFLPCLEDVCDGSGMVFNEETGLEDPCICMVDHAAEPIREIDL